MYLSNCEFDILNNFQQKYDSVIYNENEVYGIMNVGKFRKKQEDSVLITSHHLQPDFKMILIADGMGGINYGGLASWYASISVYNWFQALEPKIFYNKSFFKNSYINFLNTLDSEIRKNCHGGGTTLVSALFFKDNVIITNIGDSRAYALSDENNFFQITRDQSIVQVLAETGLIKNDDSKRFHKKSNLILSRLGCESKKLEIDLFEIDNTKFQNIYLFSDGITDCISNERLSQIVSNDSSNLACNQIVEEVLHIDTFCYMQNNEDYYRRITAGKDNMSLVYTKKRFKSN